MQDEAGDWIRIKQVRDGNGKSRLYLQIALIPASVHCWMLFGCDWYDRLKIFALKLKLHAAGLVSIITFQVWQSHQYHDRHTRCCQFGFERIALIWASTFCWILCLQSLCKSIRFVKKFLLWNKACFQSPMLMLLVSRKMWILLFWMLRSELLFFYWILIGQS